MKIGLELEYWVVDGRGELASAAPLVEAHPYAVRECVDSLVELVLPPAVSRETLEATVVEAVSELSALAAANGLSLVPLGTTLVEAIPPATSARGVILEQVYGEELRFAKNVAGTHVHFDRTDATAQANLLTALDPALALVATTPYYGGRRTTSCARAAAYRRGTSARFDPYRRLQPYVRSDGERYERTRRTFESFVDLALAAGVDPRDVHEHFGPGDAVHGPVRVRDELGTVEWRAPDAALPSQVLRLACDVAGVLAELETKPLVVGNEPGIRPDRIVVPPFERLLELVEEAIYRGLTPAVRAYLEAFGLDPVAYSPLTETAPERGLLSGAEARELRLRYAALLETDLSTLRERREGMRRPTLPDPGSSGRAMVGAGGRGSRPTTWLG
jgi:gamma-glutamyl:cysteine ligase YbdK (ATP-grasp superfamily)